MKYLAVILLCSSLAGCGSLLGPTPTERLTASRDACVGYGFEPGTDAYSNCVMQVNEMNTTRDMERRKELGDAIRASFSSGTGHRTTVCNTNGSARANGFGTVYGNATTTCY